MKLVRNYLLAVGMILLGGLATIPFYEGIIKFTMQKNDPEFQLTISLSPILVFIMSGGLISMIIAHSWKKSKSKTPLEKTMLIPHSLPEDDEREREIVGKACKNSYIAMWFSWPIIAALMALYPLIADVFPYYPLILILLIPFIQTTIYFITFKKIY